MLQAAEGVFAEKGIQSATLDDIAAAAGLTKGAIYSNFASKQELFAALMEEHVAERMRRTAEIFEQSATTDEAIQDVGDKLLEFVQTDATWQRLLIEYAVHASRELDTRIGLRERRRELRESLGLMIERLSREHGFDLPFSPEECATVVLALSNGFMIEGGMDEDAVPPDLFGRVLAVLVSEARGSTTPS